MVSQLESRARKPSDEENGNPGTPPEGGDGGFGPGGAPVRGEMRPEALMEMINEKLAEIQLARSLDLWFGWIPIVRSFLPDGPFLSREDMALLDQTKIIEEPPRGLQRSYWDAYALEAALSIAGPDFPKSETAQRRKRLFERSLLKNPHLSRLEVGQSKA